MILFFLLLLGLPEPLELAHSLQTHVRFLADDALQGRKTSTSGLDVAAAYIETQLAQHQLTGPYSGKHSYYQDYPLDVIQLDAQSRIKIQGRGAPFYGRFGQEFFLYPTDYSPVNSKGPIIFAGYGHETTTYSDFKGLDVRGHWVVFIDGKPDTEAKKERIYSKYFRALVREALGVIVLKKDRDMTADQRMDAAETMRLPGREEVENQNRFPIIVLYEDQWPAFFGRYYHRFERAVPQLKQGKPVNFLLKGRSLSCQLTWEKKRKTARNVIGIIEGTDPKLKDEYIVCVAHYDHIGHTEEDVYNGADDNASGTATLLMLAERLKHVPRRRSIMFLFCSGEEQGLLGSRWFVNNPPVPLAKIVGCLNFDMVGRGETGKIGVVPSTEQYQQSTINETLQMLNKEDHGLELLNTMDKFYRRSDHYNFIDKGVPAVFFIAGLHEDYHGPNDHWEKLDYHEMSRRYALFEDLALTLLNNEEPPRFLEKNAN